MVQVDKLWFRLANLIHVGKFVYFDLKKQKLIDMQIQCEDDDSGGEQGNILVVGWGSGGGGRGGGSFGDRVRADRAAGHAAAGRIRVEAGAPREVVGRVVGGSG